MSHDLEDLLEIIRALEERVLSLELISSKEKMNLPDSYYWEHG